MKNIFPICVNVASSGDRFVHSGIAKQEDGEVFIPECCILKVMDVFLSSINK
jgi:hypothetical protein